MRRAKTISTAGGRRCLDHKRQQRMRCGTAALEFAVVAPVITVIFLSSINAMQQITLSHNLRMVSHMAAMEVAHSPRSLPDLETRFEEFGAQAGLRDIEVSITEHNQNIYSVKALVPLANNNPMMTTSVETISAESYVYRVGS